MVTIETGRCEDVERERLLRALAGATFVIFFQAYMVAPIIPTLASGFETSVQTAGLVVPAYLIPYSCSTLAYGLLADRIGIHRIMFASLAALTALTATARSVEELALWRILSGIGASGVVPLALVLVGRLFPYNQRGRPLGWLYGAMAGGMAFGSPFGAIALPLIGWQGLFLLVAAAGGIMLLALLRYRRVIGAALQPASSTLADLVRGYRSLLGGPRGRRTYGYVLVNSLFHSGSLRGSASISNIDTASGRPASAWRYSVTVCRDFCWAQRSDAWQIVGDVRDWCPSGLL